MQLCINAYASENNHTIQQFNSSRILMRIGRAFFVFFSRTRGGRYVCERQTVGAH